MKKLFTLLTMLVLGIGSSWGQVVTNRSSAGDPMTYNQFKAFAGTGKRFAIVASSDNPLVYPKWFSFATGGYPETLTTSQLFVLENSTTGEGWYNIKRVSDDKYVSTEGGNFDASTKMDFKLVNRRSNDYASEFSNSDLHVSLDNAAGNHYNANPSNLGFRAGTGGYSTYITYGPIYRVIFKCMVNGELIYTTAEVFAKENNVLNVPDLPGYTASPSSYTVGSGDASPEITYTPSSYPVNFTREQTFTRSDRHINSVTFDIEGEDQTVNELYNNTSTKCYQDLTDSKTVTLPVNTSVQPKFSVTGAWQHGFVYIDLNNDGDFTDEGELVSKINEGNPNLSTGMPSFITPSTPGTYRMRIKTDWASEDPGGNTGDAPHTITSNNHIIKNGGMIVDVNLVISAYEVTYQVQDENENVLFTSSAVPTTLGTNITTLPAQYQKEEFYDYNTLDITISDLETTAVFTATKKDAPLVKFTADATTPVWYKMKLKDDNYPTYVNSTPNVTTPTTNADNETVQWAFIGNPYAGFHIICRAAKDGSDNYLVLGSGTTTGSADNGGSVHAAFAAEGSQNNELWDIRPSNYLTGGFFIFNTEGHALNERNTANLAYWTGGNDKGSTFTATEVLEGEALFNSLVEELKAIRWGLISEGNKGKVNYYNLTSGAGDLYGHAGNELTLVNILEENGYSEENLGYAQTMFDNHALNMPTAGKFYRIKGNTSSKYLAAGLASNSKFNMTDATDATTIFYYDGTKLTNLSSGMCNGLTAKVGSDEGWNWVVSTSASTVTFLDGHTNGGYGIESNTVYIYDNGNGNPNSADRGANVDMTTDNTRYRSWYLEPVTSLPFEIEANSYKSFSAPVAITIPGNCKAYIAKTKNNNTIKMEEVTGNVPANTGIIIGTEADANPTFDIYDGSEFADCTGNMLVANVAASALSRNENYFFGKQKSTGNYIFTKLSGTGDNYTLYGFKSYLPAANLPDAVDARIAVIWDDDPTGLNELKDDSMEVKDGKYYQNQKIVVIRNGVKYNVAGQIIK